MDDFQIMLSYAPTGDQGRGQGTQIHMPQMEEPECANYLRHAVNAAMASKDSVLFRVWKNGRFDAAILVTDGGLMPRSSVTIPDCIFSGPDR